MPDDPLIGQSGGQHYDVARAIQTFLGQMAEGGIEVASAVIKELLQNADDAGASEVHVVLDEREHNENYPAEYRPLFWPALLVRNNAPFRDSNDVGEGQQNDFAAICDVASGHKRFQATAAGRFGIGFNSVYFLTDTPVLFSRREVHIFDLLHRIFAANGWKFPLDAFPATAGVDAGPVKNVLERILPKAALGCDSAFGAIAGDASGDYTQAILRIPLRQQHAGARPLYPDLFPAEHDRVTVLEQMSLQAARAILFLKNVERIHFGILTESGITQTARVEASGHAPAFQEFQRAVESAAQDMVLSEDLSCAYSRDVTFHRFPQDQPPEKTVWPYHIRHSGRFNDPDLLEFRKRLDLNEERAVPWASVGIPLSPDAIELDGPELPRWRVFLPLLEPGPSGCVFSAALFVGPSRQKVEFRTDGSDDARRKTEWNKLLVSRGLVPLLREASMDMLDLLPELIEEHPKEYLSLFPIAREDAAPGSLSEHLQACFAAEPWYLRLHDIWGETIELLIGSDDEMMSLEMVADWLTAYRDCFIELSHDGRRFVRWSLGEALRLKVADSGSIVIRRDVSPDVAKRVLVHDDPPSHGDLEKLITRSAGPGNVLSPTEMSNCWAFSRAGDGCPLRYQDNTIFIVESDDADSGIHGVLRALPLKFEGTEWVSADVGLPAVAPELRRQIENVSRADQAAALELLRRVAGDHEHNVVAQAASIVPVVDFLVGIDPVHLPSDLRLAFLVRYAHGTSDRQSMGTVLLKPDTPSQDETALWEGLFRRSFTQVDPAFASELHRLLDVHPALKGAMALTSTSIEIPSAKNALDILARARERCPERFASVQDHVARSAVREQAERASRVVLAEADRSWDGLSHDHRVTVQALPLHRLASGDLVSLCDASGGDCGSVNERFRVQSQEDIQDAPIDLPDCRLLHSSDREMVRFYRTRLGIEEHGRAAVLKDILRQIGSSGLDSHKLLRYLARHLPETLERLDESSEDIHRADAAEMRSLLDLARVVPCEDGEWRCIEDTHSVWLIAELLQQQGWSRRNLTHLLPTLYDAHHLASLESRDRTDLARFAALDALSTTGIARQAVVSESPDLSLQQRAKLLADNMPNSLEGVERAEILDDVKVPCLGGPQPLSKTEMLDSAVKGLPKAVLEALGPNTVDLDLLSSELGTSQAKTRTFLEVLDIPSVDAETVDARIEEMFSAIWPLIDESARIDLLDHIGRSATLTEALSADASDLPVVLASDGKWVSPGQAVQPDWLATKPPFLSGSSLPALESLPKTVRLLWNRWCGLNSFRQLLETMLAQVGAQNKREWEEAAKTLGTWFDRVLSSEQTEQAAVISDLTELPWVLARRESTLDFQLPSDVIVHAGADVLHHRFWVPVVMPRIASKHSTELGFPEAPDYTETSIGDIADCLVLSTGAEAHQLAAVYALVADMIDADECLGRTWGQLAASNAVYHLFREDDAKTTQDGLFLGDRTHQNDIGGLIFCIRDGGQRLPRGLLQILPRLGIPERPTPGQALAALSRISGTVKQHGSCYEVLVNLAVGSEHDVGGSCRVPACSGTYEPLSSCYWDDELGWPSRVSRDDQKHLINTRDRHCQRLIEWIEGRPSSPVRHLRRMARREIVDAPVVGETPTSSQQLGPWRDLLRELTRESAIFQSEMLTLMGDVPHMPLAVAPVSRIKIRYVLPDKQVVEQAESWRGPLAANDGDSTIFVLQAPGDQPPALNASEMDTADRTIAIESLDLVRICAGSPHEPTGTDVDWMLRQLERPSTVLDRMRRENQEHFFHQYHDQVADPAFASLFEEYRKTRRETARYHELEERMREIMTREYVRARRDQIRGYGYDEFSIFAELIQNAEDAYLQRLQLGMDTRSHCPVRFRYVREGGDQLVLRVEHFGRPFNYWRNGQREDPNFKRDVEGVLRSAGSFKPHSVSEQSEDQTVGRFGLGFKSVYLITDQPAIHSEWWHFAIEAGCLPRELLPPTDLPADATRIELPLRISAEELCDGDGRQLINLLPFLREVDQLELQASVGIETNLFTRVVRDLDADEGVVVEKVVISGASHVRGDCVRFLRLRNTQHGGQLGIYLAQDGLPAPWSEAFSRDAFVVLPLQASLGCGVAVSNRFEVQSGRTHLVDPVANGPRVDEVAGLMKAVPQALMSCLESDDHQSEMLHRFWSIWRWNSGDAETESLRRKLALSLAMLPSTESIVPTLDPEQSVSLEFGPVFYFQGIPEKVRQELLSSEFPVVSSVVQCANSVPDSFVTAYRQTCHFAGIEPESSLVHVDWAAIGATCQDSAWLAEHPTLLDSIAEALPDGEWCEVCEWLPGCLVAGCGHDGNAMHAPPSDLCAPDFDGIEHLPRRLLDMLDSCYASQAVDLLLEAGLQPRPTGMQIEDWIHDSDLTPDECNSLLHYLAEEQRYMDHDYRGLSDLFRSPWFPTVNGQVNTSDAHSMSLIDTDVLDDESFKAWLGAGGGPLPGPIPALQFDAQQATEWLNGLVEWWNENRDAWTSRYEDQVYPEGRPYVLNSDFHQNDRRERRNWLSLFMLGSFLTMGRQTAEQHRGFLRLCDQKGWLDVFADPQLDAANWMRVLEGYLDEKIEQAEYYQWISNFVRIFHLSRWLPEYVHSFLAIDRFDTPFDLSQVVAPRAAAVFQGGGPDAPPITRALGMGANFVVRELLRLGILNQPLAWPHGFLPVRRVRQVLWVLGCDGVAGASAGGMACSPLIHRFLTERLGDAERATFGGSFDLPLLAVADGAGPAQALPQCPRDVEV